MSANYRQQYCQQCIRAGDAGYSLNAFAGMIGVARSTLTDWMSQFPEFASAVEVHGARHAKFWEDHLARIALEGGKSGSATAVMFALKNAAIADEKPDVVPPQNGPDGRRERQFTEYRLSDESIEKLKGILE